MKMEVVPTSVSTVEAHTDVNVKMVSICSQMVSVVPRHLLVRVFMCGWFVLDCGLYD